MLYMVYFSSQDERATPKLQIHTETKIKDTWLSFSSISTTLQRIICFPKVMRFLEDKYWRTAISSNSHIMRSHEYWATCITTWRWKVHVSWLTNRWFSIDTDYYPFDYSLKEALQQSDKWNPLEILTNVYMLSQVLWKSVNIPQNIT